MINQFAPEIATSVENVFQLTPHTANVMTNTLELHVNMSASMELCYLTTHVFVIITAIMGLLVICYAMAKGIAQMENVTVDLMVAVENTVKNQDVLASTSTAVDMGLV